MLPFESKIERIRPGFVVHLTSIFIFTCILLLCAGSIKALFKVTFRTRKLTSRNISRVYEDISEHKQE